MQYKTRGLLLALATIALAAPIDNEKRQLESAALPSASGLSITFLSGVALPTGLSSSSGSLSGLGSSLGGLSSPLSSGLGSSTGSLGSSSSGLGSSTGSLESSSDGLTGLDDSSDLTPTATLKERQSLESLGSLSSGTSGLGNLGSSSSSGLGSLSSLGSLSGSSGSSSLGSLTGSSTAAASSSSSTSSTTTSSDGNCKALTFIFARGTGEVGTMGTIIGAPLATALANKLGADKVSAQGVDYPADAAGNANLGASGGPAMAKLATAALSSCPDSKVVLCGYSQGAMVAHNALSDQGVDGSKVAAVVAFGDPLNGQTFTGVDTAKVKEYCGSSDALCSSGGTDVSGSHLDYGSDADAAATWIVSTTGL